MRLALYQPDIPQNTGTLLRTAMCLDVAVDIIEPCGFVFSDCGFDLGLPAWLAIEEWLPWLFRVEASCGYTPELIFGITMAEALMVLSVLLLLVSFCVFLVYLFNIKQDDKTL